jgi:hypothetical protein
LADENIAYVAADPCVPVIVHNQVNHFVMGVAFAGRFATLDVEVIEVLTGEIGVFCQSFL